VTELIVLYRMPKDAERFDKYYRDTAVGRLNEWLAV
jgi:hypothetical protein